MRALVGLLVLLLMAPVLVTPISATAQTPPSSDEIASYSGLHAAAANGDAVAIAKFAASGGDLNARDGHGRTPLIVAAHGHDLGAKDGKHLAAATALIKAGADLNLLDTRAYDALTVAGVAGDLAMVKLLLKAGAKPGQTTSPYEGTALIACAHRGHVEIVKALIKAGAPLDHINNLGWTALIEAIILGDGGANHTAIVEALVKAGADVNIADRSGRTPLSLARQNSHGAIIKILEAAGAKP